MDNMLPGYTTAVLNAMEGIQHKSYSEVVIEGVRRIARVFVVDLLVRKTDKRYNMVVCFPGAKIEAITERVEKPWVRAREDLF